VAWKLLNPTNQRKNPECPENAETYELVTKYNYTPQEKAAIIEVEFQKSNYFANCFFQQIITMIKGVQSLLAKMEAELSVAIRQHIYAELQDFVGGTLRDLLAKAIKHKKVENLEGSASNSFFILQCLFFIFYITLHIHH
jgi:cytoplasmic FMR1 interacting protein